MDQIDSHSPVPLYHQIALLIRGRIERGELAPGDSLKPLREAAEAWKVNFHTVRHAYAELAREGLLEIRGPLGTRVIESGDGIPPPRRQQDRLEAFVTATLHQARSEYGLSPAALANLIAAPQRGAGNVIPRAHVLECSQHQCEDLSRQLQAAWHVEAVPWCLDRDGDLPAGTLIATHFHYNEIRLRWPRRLAQISFVSISPHPGVRARIESALSGDRPARLIVCERDRPTAEAVAADISALLKADEHPITTRIVDNPDDIPNPTRGKLLLLPPRIWGAQSAEDTKRDDIVEVRYRYDAEELAVTARKLGWTAKQHPVSSVSEKSQ